MTTAMLKTDIQFCMCRRAAASVFLDPSLCVQFACLKLWGVSGRWEGFSLCVSVYDDVGVCARSKMAHVSSPFMKN